MKKIILKTVCLYKKYLSTPLTFFFGPGCRYQPTCSVFAQEAVKRFGLLKGGKLAILRFFSCHPFSKRNSFDPVPLETKD